MRYTFILLLVAFSSITLYQCTPEQPSELPAAYLDSLQQWKAKRVDDLKAPDGFLNLAGLYWLQEGKNTFGSDSSNNVIAPEGMPSAVGIFYADSTQVSFKASGNAAVMYDGEPVDSLTIFDAKREEALSLEAGSFSWVVIERAGNYGIRLRDLQHPMLTQPLDLAYFPPSGKWKINATFEPYDPPRSTTIDNVVGFTFESEVLGRLVFTLDEKQYSLEPMVEGNQYFIMFADQTNNTETYGAGRYMYTSLPDENGQVVVDFNKAYNPPCAFTAYATCPLPPKQNRLNLKVEAGEKNYHGE